MTDPGPIIYEWTVDTLTEEQRIFQNIPAAYRVHDCPRADGGVMVYGKHNTADGMEGDEWYSNPSLRYLVKHLIEENKRMAG